MRFHDVHVSAGPPPDSARACFTSGIAGVDTSFTRRNPQTAGARDSIERVYGAPGPRPPCQRRRRVGHIACSRSRAGRSFLPFFALTFSCRPPGGVASLAQPSRSRRRRSSTGLMIGESEIPPHGRRKSRRDAAHRGSASDGETTPRVKLGICDRRASARLSNRADDSSRRHVKSNSRATTPSIAEREVATRLPCLLQL